MSEAAASSGTVVSSGADVPWIFESPSGRPPLELSGRPRVMGIVNITPDSFSDGGNFLDPGAAVAHGERLVAEGADLLDLGAESTRPGGGVYGDGARELSVDEELDRLMPVLESLRRRLPETWISVDTRKGKVAAVALAAGADLVNDVGGLEDPALVEAVAAAGCPVVIMHSRGELATMQRHIAYDDPTAEVAAELEQRMARGIEGGIDRERMIVDPGIGFGKGKGHNYRLIGELDRLGSKLGRPVLLGASRKSFIGALDDSPADRRLGGSLGAAAWGAAKGVSIVRCHDVFETVQLFKVWNAIHSSSTNTVS